MEQTASSSKKDTSNVQTTKSSNVKRNKRKKKNTKKSDVDRATASSDSTKEEVEDKPILLLFKELVINNDNNIPSTIRDAQLKAILKEEFNLDTNKMHPLGDELYMTILKHYLKEWPLWQEFDRIVTDLTANNKLAEKEETIKEKSLQFKNYMLPKLEYIKPLAEEKVALIKKLEKKNIKKTIETFDTSKEDISLEIHCTRAQLYNILYRHPHPEKNNTVFNNTIQPSTTIRNMPDVFGLLNWWNIKIVINGQVCWTRHTVHEVRRVLVNKTLNIKSTFDAVDTDFQEKADLNVRQFKKSLVINFFKYIKKTMNKHDVNVLVDTLLEDIKDLPEILFPGRQYRRFFYKYPYVRYLYTEVPEAKDSAMAETLDLQIEETIMPRFQIDFGKTIMQLPKKCNHFVIKLQCLDCMSEYFGSSEQLIEHLRVMHENEPDWQCSNCKQVFDMVTLSKNRWCHDCQ